MTAVASAAQYVTLTAPGVTVRALRGDASPILTGGFGGWTQVARPRRKALTQWDGEQPLELTFSILFDGFENGQSVEADCLTLERLARQQQDGSDPPIVRHGGGMPHPELDWIVSDLSWDVDPVYSQSGNRVRQQVTVKLLEHVAAEAIPTAASVAAAKSGGATKAYVVKTGDTLSSIAAKQLGDHKRWTEIATLNGIRDPKSIRAGQRLRLP